MELFHTFCSSSSFTFLAVWSGFSYFPVPSWRCLILHLVSGFTGRGQSGNNGNWVLFPPGDWFLKYIFPEPGSAVKLSSKPSWLGIFWNLHPNTFRELLWLSAAIPERYSHWDGQSASQEPHPGSAAGWRPADCVPYVTEHWAQV